MDINKAVTEALRRHPILNAAVDERNNELVFKKYYNIGVATSTEAGLMVPVVRNADRLRLFELARRIEQGGVTAAVALHQQRRVGQPPAPQLAAPEHLQGTQQQSDQHDRQPGQRG